ncbi:siphovirus Gp157 family protein [Clostridium perfringens]|uniref:siphovirus Gp157 family protein n=1 Tax=Clostridium perfringens TaxID=1502 RepID=UPI0013E3C507|nr:siphovirus Gp157 family protein [Clostridium perfringens]MDK0558316.1 siphovirus Gp157 family protein [Clostridium perfringens]MDK0574341.1 siphovirus Gp157 family protein [Clostridium perfringens]MDM0955530.1 siphovirus Gp157 family protein [Clostridium perfringens]MDU2048634.1 siphovirus Gp157 family protein [Clostridium perfringens]MDU5649743.1 siphovirus Gp157 family protein [Clostridium perfringens]
MKLYELTQNYRNLESLLDNLGEQEGLTVEMIHGALGQVEDDINTKIENTCKVIKEIEADSIGIDEEIKRLSALKKQKENAVKKLKEYVEFEMNGIGLNKVEGKLFKISFRKSKVVKVLDETKIPKEFIKVKTTESISKTDLGKALKSGEIIEGAELVENKTLQIK